jgi:hypothetical protein
MARYRSDNKPGNDLFLLVCGIFLTGPYVVAATRKPERRRRVEDDI